MRIGIGFDVHKFQKGRSLIIGGVDISYQYGLEGHSDADVLTHALMDAILGALGRGDIGKHFPDNDPEYKDINSLKLLGKVKEFLITDNYKISNIDMIIMAEEPKMAPFYSKIKSNYTNVLNISSEIINIKATTTEQLGFVGRKEGMAAQVVVLLCRRGENNAS
ncbi:MAG: 2-C-methyl-D-erythritol 2,4-cyclodiphosphate synthase [Bacillota bacterium]